jgi:hypothetical protein
MTLFGQSECGESHPSQLSCEFDRKYDFISYVTNGDACSIELVAKGLNSHHMTTLKTGERITLICSIGDP